MAEPSAVPRAPASGASCPGCGKGIDPLRAGHVAVFDGVFLYYCDQGCKAVHLRAIAANLDDVATLDPPAVMERLAPASHERRVNGRAPTEPRSAPVATTRAQIAPEAENKGVKGQSAGVKGQSAGVEDQSAPNKDQSAANKDQSAPNKDPSAGLEDQSAWFEDPSAQEEDESAPVEAPIASVATVSAPVTMRSPSLPDAAEAREAAPVRVVDDAPRAAGPSLRDRARVGVAAVAIALGALVALLGAAGVPTAARLALACVAALGLVARLALARRDAADAHPVVAVVPVALALAAAAVAQSQGDARAAAMVTLGALGAAVAAACEEGLFRVRREVEAARAKVRAALEASPRGAHAGEVIELSAGDVSPVDGAVVAGDAAVVPWLDAPLEAQKVEGDAIVAGARVVAGRVRVTTIWSGAERAWVRACGSSAARADVSAPVARVARLLLERGAPALAALAGVAAMVGGSGSSAIDGVAVACAAAMALGARGVVGVVAWVHARGQMRALAHGVAYKDARAFDEAGRVAVAVVCSRGTVLTGEPEIVALEGVGESRMSEASLLALAAGAETASTHPFAAAILRAARARTVTPEAVRSTTVHPGLGVTALAASGERLVVGSRALLLQEKVSVAVAEARASEMEAQGRSVLLIALAGKLVGLVALQDGLRAGARAAVQRLLDARIEPVLLSGESRETCETLARALDIDHVRPEVLPADRGAEVRALAEGGHVVAVVGHAASDDGALGAADVSVAMTAPRGGEWAVALASDDVRDAALALSIPHAARDRARAALAAGLAPGVAVLLALAFGVAPLVVAPLATAAGFGAALIAARREG